MTAVALADGFTVAVDGPDSLLVAGEQRRLRLRLLDPGVLAALAGLGPADVAVADLRRRAVTEHPDADLTRLRTEIDNLAGRSALRLRCLVAGREALTAAPTSTLARLRHAASPEPVGRYRLSRFACLRWHDDRLVIESHASYFRIGVTAPEARSLLLDLVGEAGVARLCRDHGRETVLACLAFLLDTGVVGAVDEHGETAEDRRPELAQREFHDVLLHASSRIGLGDQPVGATFRHRGRIPPSPAVRPLPAGRRQSLPVPDLVAAMRDDPPLARVMETRRSIRRAGTRTITAGELGELLYRVVRVRSTRPADPEAGVPYETTDRPCPSGGAAHDLEVYLTVRACDGILPGIYHYDPTDHALTLVCDDLLLVKRMLRAAYVATGRESVPQVLVTLAARFARVSWKYEGIAHAITLKNVGVLFEAMYLAATALGLAPCALGSGDSVAFAGATGLDPMVESSVGEFALSALSEEAS